MIDFYHAHKNCILGYCVDYSLSNISSCKLCEVNLLINNLKIGIMIENKQKTKVILFKKNNFFF